jgi:S-layer homology domain
MNESMPPEMSPSTPEDDERRREAVAAPLTATTENLAIAGSSADRRKHDEWIAVVVALLGIGSVLWFALGRSNPLMANLPFQLPGMGSATGSGATGSGATNPSPTTIKPAEIKETAPAGTIAPPQATDNRNGDDPNNGNFGANVAAGVGVAGVGAASTIAPPAKADAAKVATNDAAPPNDALPVPPSPPAGSVQPDATKVGGEASPEPALPSPTKPKFFSDVPETAAIAPYVAALSSRGLMDGFKDNTFLPNQPITRAEFAGILQKAFEKPRVKPALSFSDIKSGDPNANAITEATQTGFLNGFPDKSFKPDVQIPRYQMQVALVTGLGLNPMDDPTKALSAYADAEKLPKWSLPKVSAAVQSGIVSSKEAKTLEPTQPATRGDAVVMIHEALVKNGKLPAIK